TGATATERLAGEALAAGWAAVDGDETTAWVSPFATPLGSTLTIDTDPATGAGTGAGNVVVTQRTEPWYSTITSFRVHDARGSTTEVTVPPPDAAGRSTIDLGGLHGPTLAFEVTGVAERRTIDRRYGEPTVLPVAIAELAGAGLTTGTVPDLLDTGCRDDLVRIDGEGVPLRITAPVSDLLRGDAVTAGPCDPGPFPLTAGAHRIETAPGRTTGLTVDRIVLTDRSDDPATGRPDTTVQHHTRTSRVVTVEPCPSGCWVVLGEGHDPAWRASVDGTGLPAPTLVDGGFNGWWLEPDDEARTVRFTWSPQPVLTTGLALTVMAVVLCGALVALDRRRRPVAAPDRPELAGADRSRPRIGRRLIVVVGALWCLAAGLVVAPLWALAPVPIVAVAVLTRSMRPAGIVALVLAAAGAITIVWRVVQWRPFPDAGWVLNFDDLHRGGLFVVTALVASAIVRDRAPGPRA
ncbi:MAG: hypothetical protein WD225_10465, partial [Ilumatobacteraceae bacterium]